MLLIAKCNSLIMTLNKCVFKKIYIYTYIYIYIYCFRLFRFMVFYVFFYGSLCFNIIYPLSMAFYGLSMLFYAFFFNDCSIVFSMDRPLCGCYVAWFSDGFFDGLLWVFSGCSVASWWVLTVFNGAQWFSMVSHGFSMALLRLLIGFYGFLMGSSGF